MKSINLRQSAVPNTAFLLPPQGEMPANLVAQLNRYRTLSFVFPSRMVDCKSILGKSTFKVGDDGVPDIMLIEKHYFKGKLVRDYEFL